MIKTIWKPSYALLAAVSTDIPLKMARETHDREDLFRDGTQMPIRGRTQIEETEVVVGFRDVGSTSLYWGQDPVYQFKAGGELRRVFFRGTRYSAERGVLVRLGQSSGLPSKQNSKIVVKHLKLSLQQLTKNEASEIQDQLQACLSRLSASLGEGNLSNWQSKGESVDAFRQRLASWIGTIDFPCAIAQNPSV